MSQTSKCCGGKTTIHFMTENCSNCSVACITLQNNFALKIKELNAKQTTFLFLKEMR